MNDMYNWRKSSYTSGQGNCVEVAPLRDGTAVRDSKDPDGPILTFPEDTWRAFIGAVKENPQLEPPAPASVPTAGSQPRAPRPATAVAL
jgi:hypothetical protein